MTAQRFGRVQKAVTLVPLALLSTAWTASLAGVSATTTVAATPEPATLPDGTSIPTEALEDPASFTQPGSLGLGLPRGSGDSIVQAASTNGIPSAALAAYQRAGSVINAADPACNLSWQLVAAIGRVESDHGRYGGNTLGSDGVSRPGIYGIALDGSNNTQAIEDTDAGQYDNDTVWDRAVGPMQFIPSTWSVVGVDADGDGRRDPQDIDDSALASAVYLCSGNDDLGTDAGRRAAVFRYNHSNSYVALVLRIMEAYMAGDFTSVPNATTSAVTFSPNFDLTRPTFQPETQGPKPARNGGSGGGSGDGGNGGSQPDSTPSEPTPTDPTPGPTTPDQPTSDPTKAVEDTVKKVEDTVKDVVKDPVKTVVDTLSYAQALTLCNAQFDLITDPLGLLNPLAGACASAVQGETRDSALAMIPNTLDGILAWL